MKKIIIMVGVLLFAWGCATPKRVVTTSSWQDGVEGSRLYLSYWEGQCGGVFASKKSCDKGEAHVKLCNAQADNGMKCMALPNLDKMLND